MSVCNVSIITANASDSIFASAADTMPKVSDKYVDASPKRAFSTSLISLVSTAVLIILFSVNLALTSFSAILLLTFSIAHIKAV